MTKGWILFVCVAAILGYMLGRYTGYSDAMQDKSSKTWTGKDYTTEEMNKAWREETEAVRKKREAESRPSTKAVE